MAKYFSYFPTSPYKVTEDTQGVESLTNILVRFKLEDSFKENTSHYYKYDIKDGDTPETVAFYAYGSAERHWIVLLYNDIVDPQYDWPLEFKTLTNYVNQKYSANNYADTANTGVSGLTWAKSNIHSYYITETTEAFGNTFSQVIQLDSGTYANTVTGSSTLTLEDGNILSQSNVKSSLTYYEYETKNNEEKRSIKILKNEFVFALEEELRTTLRR